MKEMVPIDTETDSPAPSIEPGMLGGSEDEERPPRRPRRGRGSEQFASPGGDSRESGRGNLRGSFGRRRRGGQGPASSRVVIEKGPEVRIKVPKQLERYDGADDWLYSLGSAVQASGLRMADVEPRLAKMEDKHMRLPLLSTGHEGASVRLLDSKLFDGLLVRSAQSPKLADHVDHPRAVQKGPMASSCALVATNLRGRGEIDGSGCR